MQILAEAEDLPKTAKIIVQMTRMATQSHVFAYCYLTAAVKVKSRQVRQGRLR